MLNALTVGLPTEEGHRTRLHAAMLDNFVLSASADIFKRANLRMSKEIDHAVTYGIVIGKHNSTNTEKVKVIKGILWLILSNRR